MSKSTVCIAGKGGKCAASHKLVLTTRTPRHITLQSPPTGTCTVGVMCAHNTTCFLHSYLLALHLPVLYSHLVIVPATRQHLVQNGWRCLSALAATGFDAYMCKYLALHYMAYIPNSAKQGSMGLSQAFLYRTPNGIVIFFSLFSCFATASCAPQHDAPSQQLNVHLLVQPFIRRCKLGRPCWTSMRPTSGLSSMTSILTSKMLHIVCANPSPKP